MHTEHDIKDTGISGSDRGVRPGLGGREGIGRIIIWAELVTSSVNPTDDFSAY